MGSQSVYRIVKLYINIHSYGTGRTSYVLYHKIVYLYYIVSQSCKQIGIPLRIVIFQFYMYSF